MYNVLLMLKINLLQLALSDVCYVNGLFGIVIVIWIQWKFNSFGNGRRRLRSRLSTRSSSFMRTEKEPVGRCMIFSWSRPVSRIEFVSESNMYWPISPSHRTQNAHMISGNALP